MLEVRGPVKFLGLQEKQLLQDPGYVEDIGPQNGMKT